MATTSATQFRKARLGRRGIVLGAVGALLLGAIALDTTVVRIASDDDLRQQAFDPDLFGQREFPRIRDFVLDRAPDAATLATALAADRTAAIADYGTMAGAFPVLAVSVTGVLGKGRSGIFPVMVEGMPDGMTIRVQTGPAINGTELRDVVGDIAFGDFTNQIKYQDAGAGINRAMSADTLSGLDRDALAGASVSFSGAFTMINPSNWLITPVAFEVR